MADPITDSYRSENAFRNAVLWTIGRTAELYAGMMLAGEKDRLLQRAIAGSLAVQAFVSSWMFFTRNNPDIKLPSAEAVQNRDILGMFATYVIRSTLVGTGMYIAGFRDNIVRNSLAGGAVIEATVIALNYAKPELEVQS